MRSAIACRNFQRETDGSRPMFQYYSRFRRVRLCDIRGERRFRDRKGAQLNNARGDADFVVSLDQLSATFHALSMRRSRSLGSATISAPAGLRPGVHRAQCPCLARRSNGSRRNLISIGRRSELWWCPQMKLSRRHRLKAMGLAVAFPIHSDGLPPGRLPDPRGWTGRLARKNYSEQGLCL